MQDPGVNGLEIRIGRLQQAAQYKLNEWDCAHHHAGKLFTIAGDSISSAKAVVSLGENS